MSEGVSKQVSTLKNFEEEVARKRSLAAALLEVKNRQANQDDVVVEMKETELARLELLGNEIRPLFDELPDDNDQFEFGMSNGKPPRLWIDMTAHVSMGHDRRTFRFLKDTRAGRVVLTESSKLELVADAIANYIAERVLERERILQGGWASLQLVEETVAEKERNRKKSAWLNSIWFALGFGISAGALYIWIVHNDWLVSLISQLK